MPLLMKCNHYKEEIDLVLSLLADEANGDTRAALKKLSDRYSMTWVYKAPKTGKLFPRSERSDPSFEVETEAIYRIHDRSYDVRNVAAGAGVVMVELIEAYTDPVSGDVRRTPLVLVIEIEGDKVLRGRHYCDPNLSYLGLTMEAIEDAF